MKILIALLLILTLCFTAFAVDLADPGADAIIVWDDDDDPEEEFATIGAGLTFSGSELDAVRREINTQAFTAGETQTTVTAAHMLASKYLTDQGGSAETDLILTAVSYYITCNIIDTEGNGFEICPPSGEALYLDGTAIAADDCIDSTGAVGATATLVRQQIADGNYKYFLWTVYGTWVDGNDTGD